MVENKLILNWRLKVKTANFLLIWLSVFLMFSGLSFGASNEFPLRKTYKDVRIYSTAQLVKNFKKSVVVDVRSKMEFDVIHINGAKNIPLGKKTFIPNLKKLRAQTGNRSIVFYCNGKTCAKSYKAARAATKGGVKNVRAFDAGIFDWAQANPALSTLLGKTPVNKKELIPSSQFKKHQIPFDNFKELTKKANSMVIDIREPFQRKNTPKLKGLRNIPMDRLIVLLHKNRFKNKSLLILDQVGKQLRWLQYHLEKTGYKNYKFLKGGVKGI